VVGFGQTHVARRNGLCTRWHLTKASRLSRRLYLFYLPAEPLEEPEAEDRDGFEPDDDPFEPDADFDELED
jgi:hypothetical protein